MNAAMPFFHVGLVVADLEAAKTEMTTAMGLTWRDTREARYGNWPIRVAYSVEGPPYVELVEGGTSGPWGTSGGPRIDHFGVWSEDIAADTARFLAAGMRVDFDPVSVGRPATFCYLHAPQAGTRVELVSTELRQLRGLE